MIPRSILAAIVGYNCDRRPCSSRTANASIIDAVPTPLCWYRSKSECWRTCPCWTSITSYQPSLGNVTNQVTVTPPRPLEGDLRPTDTGLGGRGNSRWPPRGRHVGRQASMTPPAVPARSRSVRPGPGIRGGFRGPDGSLYESPWDHQSPSLVHGSSHGSTGTTFSWHASRNLAARCRLRSRIHATPSTRRRRHVPGASTLARPSLAPPAPQRRDPPGFRGAPDVPLIRGDQDAAEAERHGAVRRIVERDSVGHRQGHGTGSPP